MPKPTANTDERQTYKVEEYARLVGVGTNQVYAAIKRGEIDGVLYFGRIIRIAKPIADRKIGIGNGT